MNKRVLAWRLVSVAVFVVACIASYQLILAVHKAVWPRYWGPSTNIMSATGYSLGGPFWRSLVVGAALAYIPKFRNIPGRYFIGAGLLLICFSCLESYLVYSRVADGRSPYAAELQNQPR
jgi:hypothetical protein